jgi:hypothetical protein
VGQRASLVAKGFAARNPRKPERERHPVPDRKGVYVFLRPRSSFYQAETFIDGRKARKSLRTDRLPTAFKLAIDWHKRLLKEARATPSRKLDRLASNPTLAELYESWRLTLTESKDTYAAAKWNPIEPYWRTIEVADVTAATFRNFYQWRKRRKTPQGTVPKNHSIHKGVMVIRQVLKYAIEEGHLATLPPIPKVGQIEANPRPWLTESEWQHLRAVSQRRIKKATNARTKQQRIDCDHFMRFMVASCGRVDEIRCIRFRDCRYRVAKGKRVDDVLLVTVTGKRGTRDLVADFDAVNVINERSIGTGRQANDLVFPEHHRDAFRELLDAAKLRRDKWGNLRNFKSLRATAISRQVLAGKDLLFIARNAGTSLAMIDTFYARRLSAEMHIRESHPVEGEASVVMD